VVFPLGTGCGIYVRVTHRAIERASQKMKDHFNRKMKNCFLNAFDSLATRAEQDDYLDSMLLALEVIVNRDLVHKRMLTQPVVILPGSLPDFFLN
jgi:hypothetical protein